MNSGEGLASQETAPAGPPDPSHPVGSKRRVLLVVIVALLALVIAKLAADGNTPTENSGSEGHAAGVSMTSIHNDARADYETAVASGKPIYVLFHSLTCEPCVEISEVADEVMPDYEGKVVFVNAVTDDPSGQNLASDFSFQYIPTSFFLSPGGESVVDGFTGPMDETDMRGFLDALIAAQ
jgi:thioredoxin-like negative regulator of GroEL